MIYALCAVVLVAGFALAWLLKREGERSWERHQQMLAAARRREAFRKVSKAFIDFQIVLVDRLTPALKKVTAEMVRLETALKEGQR